MNTWELDSLVALKIEAEKASRKAAKSRRKADSDERVANGLSSAYSNRRDYLANKGND